MQFCRLTKDIFNYELNITQNNNELSIIYRVGKILLNLHKTFYEYVDNKNPS